MALGVNYLDGMTTAATTIPRLTNNVRLDEHWILVRLPIAPAMPLPKVGDLNTAKAVAGLYA